MPTTTLSGQVFSRSQFESLLKRRFFYTESCEIYRTAPNYKGDNRGLFDYGPPGCALLANIINEWRQHFVIEENMLELDCTAITPEAGEFLRADHLLETVLETRIANARLASADSKIKTEKPDESTIQQYEEILAKLDNYDGPELGKLIADLDIRNPNGNGQVEEPTAFNLMFKSTIGPSSAAPVFFRPETAQGQFLNFRELLDYCQGSMPFASACIVLLAEVEHFVDPESSKSHERFSEIEQIELPFLDRQTQLSGKTTIETASIGSAVKSKLVDNETLGYFLARIYLFLIKLGADPEKIRFRQHLDNEMAHYAVDYRDAELLTSYGTTTELTAEICSIKKITRVENMREYTPNVIEPSFGIGRILYSILEHVYWYRPQDTAREVLSLPILTAPIKVLLVPLSNNPSFKPVIKSLALRLRSMGITSNVDASGVSIGKRYARNDELGTPLGITVDFETIKDGSITLRERDSTTQVRASEEQIVKAVKNLVLGSETWQEVSQRLPAFLTGQTHDE
ncbi:glycyl-tRNA synthetase [Akanthomyces lecanii RCEF 1005]|uniref:Glycyl-tRNA synthetase n=1 Tax=Akanthomyces lecanii RCEF 1005 TaxID=1081108 RepID=A0A168HQF0_CORDF|nr:glycyl-tRNA synthetase [Akanthomyces lecanii RCEF 1005]